MHVAVVRPMYSGVRTTATSRISRTAHFSWSSDTSTMLPQFIGPT
jgi:hypothetical protein